MTKTTILVEDSTREQLRHIGTKGQTYDDVINGLIDATKTKQDSLDRRFGSLQSSESRRT
ncbi:MAG: hypothetical protein DLM72_18140 [Candidatus Nitrosopolaris wilkensis]|nr:MAG: hypothetical protein DLM72_18140 [Candidatus Nitrosopolaris wilkensis]